MISDHYVFAHLNVALKTYLVHGDAMVSTPDSQPKGHEFDYAGSLDKDPKPHLPRTRLCTAFGPFS